jgi:hypothetical protein
MNIEHKSELFNTKLFNLIYEKTRIIFSKSELQTIINIVNADNEINAKYDNLMVKLQSMRTYQKSYFKGNKSHLKEAMDREKVIDKIIDDYFSPQSKLF